MAGCIYFVRHGESHANAGGASMPHAAIPLTGKGWRQARAVVEALPVRPACVVTSTLLRTQQTAQPYCAQHGIVPRADARLDEMNILPYDMIAGMDGAARKPLAQEYWQRGDPALRMGAGADSFYDFVARVDGFMTALPGMPDDSVIFGHGMWCAMLGWRLAGRKIDGRADMLAWRAYQQAMVMDNACIYRLTAGAGGPSLALYRAGPCEDGVLSQVL